MVETLLAWKKKMLTLFGFALGTAVGLVIGCHFLGAYTPSAQVPDSAAADFRLIAEAWNTIERFYVDRSAVNGREMTYGAISGMTAGLGDTGHSRFLTPEMVKQEKETSRGILEGIGAEVRMKNNHVTVVTPLDNSPAQKAGLKPGDIILKVNGRDMTALPLEQAVGLILGRPGTPVDLRILNTEGQSRDIRILRARIKLENVTWVFLPGGAVAHLRIASFSGGTTRDLRKSLTEIQQKRDARLILDLRNNPGGLFEEAIGAASQFLRAGTVVQEKDARGRLQAVPVEPDGIAREIPMVVIVNEGSASGAEIVAGALQDHGRARILGEKTFGGGTVLQRFFLSDGSAMLLAVNEWLTPAGRIIWHQGILPNIEVTLPAEGNPSFPAEEKKITLEQLQASKDIQLLRGLEILRPSSSRSKL